MSAKIDGPIERSLRSRVSSGEIASSFVDNYRDEQESRRSSILFVGAIVQMSCTRAVAHLQRLPMSLIVYGHLFSSYTQKVFIALYENSIPFEFRSIGPDTPEHSAEWLRRWPMRKFPLLVDGERNVVETSIIIEYLHLVHPGPVRLLPADPLAALDVRFLDRFFDLHVMDPVQVAVGSAIKVLPMKPEDGLAIAKERLERAYGWLEGQLAGKTWAAGEDFTLADCAAAPSLFYADWTHRISEAYPELRAYRARLLARPSFARAVNDARPFRSYFPLGAPDRD